MLKKNQEGLALFFFLCEAACAHCIYDIFLENSLVKNLRLITPTLYALASITVLAGAAVAPALDEIAGNFPQVDPIFIKMLITIPAIMVIPFSMISHKLSEHFGKKRVLLIGLFLYFVGGCGGGLVSNIWLLLGSRAVLGMGMGIITPVSHALPSEFYTGKERVRVVGRMSAFITIGAAICSIAAGWLALLSWRASFAVYAGSLPVALMVFLFLPLMKEEKKTGVHAEKKPSASTLPLKVWGLSFSMLLYMAVFYTFPLGIALYLKESGLGDATLAGYLLALLSVVAFCIGLVFETCMNLFGRMLLPVVLFCMGLGYVLTSQATGTFMILAGGCLAGVGLGVLTPYILLAVNRAVPRERTGKAMSLAIAGNFTGQFLSPFLSRLIEALPFVGSSGKAYGFIGLALFAAGCVALTVLLFPEKDSPQVNKK